jgi:sugar lactone lactonase YvrE
VLDQLGTTLYVADSQGNTLWGVSVPGGVATNLATFSFDDGPEPTALSFDGLGQLILGVGDASLTVEGLTVFP